MDVIKHSVLKTSAKLWLRLLLASVFCFVVWASVFALGTALFSEEVGYRIYQLNEEGTENFLVTEYRYKDNEERPTDIPLEEGQSVYPLRENSSKTEAGVGAVSMLFTLIIFGVFPYNTLWTMGSHDNNYVQLGRMSSDRLFGFKVGLLTAAPMLLLYGLLVLGKMGIINGVVLKWYRLFNTAFIPYIDGVSGGVTSATELTVGALLALGVVALFIPLVCTVAYWLGFSQISVRERLVYSKKAE